MKLDNATLMSWAWWFKYKNYSTDVYEKFIDAYLKSAALDKDVRLFLLGEEVPRQLTSDEIELGMLHRRRIRSCLNRIWEYANPQPVITRPQRRAPPSPLVQTKQTETTQVATADAFQV